MMIRSTTHSITRILLACMIWQAVMPSVAIALGDISFDIQRENNGTLRFSLKENNTPLINNIDLASICSEQAFGSTAIERDGDRFLVHYNSDTTQARMGLVIQANGDIELKNSMDTSASYLANDEVEFYEPANTLSELGVTWSFKTSGKLTNTGNLLFYIINTHAREFHNYGIIKALTGTMRQTYQYNVGCFDFGDHKASGAWWNAYDEAFQKIKENNTPEKTTPAPQFANNTVDDYGVFLSKYGHKIEGLTYRNLGIYLNDGNLELKQAHFNNSGTLCFIAGQVKGQQHSWINNEPALIGTFEGSIPKAEVTSALYLMQDTALEAHDWTASNWLVCIGNLSLKLKSKSQSKIGSFAGIDITFELQNTEENKKLTAGFFTRSGFVRQRTIKEHYVNKRTTTHNQYGAVVYVHETGYLLTKTEYGEKIIDVRQYIPNFEKFMGFYKERKDPIDAIKESIRKNLYKLAAANAHKNDLLYGLMQALAAAGVSSDFIEAVLTDPEIESLLDSIAAWPDATEAERAFLTDLGTDAGFSLKQMAGMAYGKGLTLVNWALQNPGNFMDVLCAAAATGRAVAPQNPVVQGLSTLCGARMTYAYASGGRFSAAARGCLVEDKQRLTHFFKGLQTSGKGLPKRSTPLGDAVSGSPERVRVTKPHGNSKEYVGDTHVYVIRDSRTQAIHKVGESMRGTNKFGQSLRAEEQRRRLAFRTGRQFETEIREIFADKTAARSWETRLIKKLRSTHGADTLPGNKGVH